MNEYSLAKVQFINLGVYLVGGIILMLTFRHKKFGSILGKEKNA